MEKRLLFGAFLLLVLEVLWLLADMNVIYIRGVTQLSSESAKHKIGFVEQRQQDLKRRYLNSIVWEETDAKDPLYLFDSVLTLDQSSAVLKLNGDTHLSLSENTLVFLEPSSRQDVDQLRVKFSRGDIKSRNPLSDLEVNASNWFIEIEKGSEVNLRTKDSENLEVEIVKGNVGIKEQDQKEIKRFESGDVIWMNKNHVETEVLSEDVRWLTPIPDLLQIRHYSHSFPVSIELKWIGEANELIWEDELGNKKELKIEAHQMSQVILLNRGLQHFRLKGKKGVSKVLPVEVWRAPEIHLFSPLPRDRYITNTPINFSWGQIDSVSAYSLQVFDKDHNLVITKNYSNKNLVLESLELEGSFEWSVEAIDNLGFKIPYFYKLPIYFIQQPLAAPQLEEPVLKTPKEDPQTSISPFYKIEILNFLFEQFVKRAHAQSETYDAIFRWKPVEGAYRYIIEIDDEPNFKSPLIIEKVKGSQFIWKNFKLGQYFWRVAAEGKENQMGLFSSVSKADLSDPKIFINSENSSLTVVKSKEKKEIEFEKPLEPVPIKEDPSPIEVKISEPQTIKNQSVSRSTKGYFLWQPTYELSQHQGEAQTKASFRGMHLISFDARFDLPVGETEDISLRVKYRDTSFKPNPETEYPFQENLKRSKASFSSYYGSSSKPRLGIKAETLQSVKRKGFEEIELNSQIGFGPSLLWPLSKHYNYSILESNFLLYGQGWSFGLELNLMADFNLSSRLKGLYGIGLEANYFQLTDQKGYQAYPYISFGLLW